MSASGPATPSLPRLGPALGTLLALLFVAGVGLAGLQTWTSFGGHAFDALTCDVDAVLHGQVWRLVTAGLLTTPRRMHLIYVLIGLYFLSPELEKRWGAARFVRFYFASTVLGFLFAIVFRLVAPGSIHGHEVVYGPAAALAGTAVAWGRENAQTGARLFFVLPIRGQHLVWFTIAFCTLGLVYPPETPEGAIAPFGGILAGYLLAGSPSLVRRTWLQMRLALLRRRGGHGAGDTVESVLAPKKPKRPGPPLRVVSGGLEDELKKRSPPKDKRYLN
ncbi:MAG: rhomboid family intramembrane serine protease [Polyangiaceae bacterium]